MNKKTIVIMLAYVGVLTGAGLASGQELLQYFVPLGITGFLGISIVALLHILIGGVLLQLGSHFIATDHSDVLDEVTNKFMSKFMDISLILTCFIVGFVMIAGAGSNLNQAFGAPNRVGSVICTVLIITIGMLDFDKVSKVIGAFTPFIVLFIIIGSVYTFMNYKPNLEDLNNIAITLPSNFDSLILTVLNYFGVCLMCAVSMAFVLGGEEINTSEAGIGGLFGGFVVGLIGILIVYTLFIRVDEIKGLDIPMLYIINDINKPLGVLMAIIIFGMIFNTSISLFYALARRFSHDEKRFRIMLIVITLIGFGFSFGGFKALVAFFFPLIGYVGIIMLFVLVYAYFKEYKSIRHEVRKRFGINYYMKKKMDKDLSYTKKDEEKLNKLIDRSHIENDIIEDLSIKRVQEELNEELKELKDEIEKNDEKES